MPTILQSINLTLPAAQSTWLDTGVTVLPGETLRVRVTGEAQKQRNSSEIDYFYPEGIYPDGAKTGTYNPSGVVTYAEAAAGGGQPATGWVVSDTAPLATSLVFSATEPHNDALPQVSAYRTNRDISINSVGAVGKVWIIVNDFVGDFFKNSGSFNVSMQRITGAAQDIDPGQPSPMRYVPPSLLAVKQSDAQILAWMIAIQPKRGGWEGYTDWDAPIDAPEYEDMLGNVTPALTYRPTGAMLSNLNTQIKLGTTAAEAQLMAPRQESLPAESFLGYFERERILKGDYEDAYYEIFEIDPTSEDKERLLWMCGHIGQSKFDDTTVTPELTSYDELANRIVGRQFGLLCDVGTEYQADGSEEDFGTEGGRCHNAVLGDGPLEADWTVEATVEDPSSFGTVRLSYGGTAVSGATLSAVFHERLANGKVVFQDSPDGGLNYAFKVRVKTGSLASAGVVDVVLKRSTLYQPVAGDKVYLTAGCTRVFAACEFYNNTKNFRGFNLVGQDDLLRRTRI